MKKQSSPMPTVTYDGETYKLRSRKLEVPDLDSMGGFSARIWINRNTTARGYYQAPDPLAGMGGAVSIV